MNEEERLAADRKFRRQNRKQRIKSIERVRVIKHASGRKFDVAIQTVANEETACTYKYLIPI
jgi:hypothetical protein